MNWKKNAYWFHRWLGLVVSVQLLAWSVGGFMFSILDIDEVHGDFEKRENIPQAIDVDEIKLIPAEAIHHIMKLSSDEITTLRLRERLGRTVYECYNEKNKPIGAVDASTGEVLAQITEEEVRRVAIADFKPEADIVSITLLENDQPLEYRGGTMPVYQVIFDHPQQTHLYISPITGNVLKRRNESWRWFDFFWMLHIMDYGERDDFNHPLLTGASVLAILTSLSGLGLWWYRIPRRKRATR